MDVRSGGRSSAAIRAGLDTPPPPTAERVDAVRLFLVVALAVVFVISVRYFVLHTLRLPHGEWDAWAVWNLKARFLLRGGEDWSALFSPLLPHPGYPLLLPGVVARLWLWIGHETPLAGAVVAAVYTYGVPLVLVGGLASLRSWNAGLWGGLLAVAATPLTFIGSYQIADVPLAYGIVSALILISLRPALGSQWPQAMLSGLAVGLAGLTKDEGLPFLLGITGVYVLHALARRTGRQRVVRIGVFVAMLIPAVILLLAIRAEAPQVGLAQAFVDSSATTRWWSLDRHLLILAAFADSIWGWAGYRGIGLAPLFGAALLVGGYHLERSLWAGAGFAVATIVMMLGAYYAAFVVTPYELTWHLTSLGRVLVHVWPAFVWLFCLGAAIDGGQAERS